MYLYMASHSEATHKKYFADQFDDENVLFLFRKHPVVMRKGLILGLIGPVIGVLPAAIHPDFGMNVFLLGFLVGLVLGRLL